MTTLLMSLGVIFYLWHKDEVSQCITYHCDVVVEINTDDPGTRFQLDDIFGDIIDSHCTLFEFLLLPRKCVVKNLNSLSANLLLFSAENKR